MRFRRRDYAHGNKLTVMRLDADEFIRRFLLHVLPRRFTRLRRYGLLGAIEGALASSPCVEPCSHSPPPNLVSRKRHRP